MLLNGTIGLLFLSLLVAHLSPVLNVIVLLGKKLLDVLVKFQVSHNVVYSVLLLILILEVGQVMVNEVGSNAKLLAETSQHVGRAVFLVVLYIKWVLAVKLLGC